MKLSKTEREEIRMMFGGFCAYCGLPLTGKWHVDHVEAVRRNGCFVKGKWIKDGTLRDPHNDRNDNLYPACVKCNILKGSGNVDTLREALSYFAHSISTIRTYSHVHHLLRFGKITIDTTPVVFWFEKYEQETSKRGKGKL